MRTYFLIMWFGQWTTVSPVWFISMTDCPQYHQKCAICLHCMGDFGQVHSNNQHAHQDFSTGWVKTKPTQRRLCSRRHPEKICNDSVNHSLDTQRHLTMKEQYLFIVKMLNRPTANCKRFFNGTNAKSITGNGRSHGAFVKQIMKKAMLTLHLHFLFHLAKKTACNISAFHSTGICNASWGWHRLHIPGMFLRLDNLSYDQVW